MSSPPYTHSTSHPSLLSTRAPEKTRLARLVLPTGPVWNALNKACATSVAII